jgi:hypothetical protein
VTERLRLYSYRKASHEGKRVVLSVRTEVKLGDGTTVEFPWAFLPVRHDLGIAPQIEADGERGVRVNFDAWHPVVLRADGAHGLPIWLPDQNDAALVAVAFDLDPATSWDMDGEKVLEWLVSSLPLSRMAADVLARECRASDGDG